MRVYIIFGIVQVGSITKVRVCGTTCKILPLEPSGPTLARIYSSIEHAAVNKPLIPISMQWHVRGRENVCLIL